MNAVRIILVHNHPTGNPEPSVEDMRITKRFDEICNMMGFDLLDHIIIGGDSFTSIMSIRK